MRNLLKGGLKRGQRGFTLIELLIVVMILGVLVAIVVPNVVGFLKTSKVAAANTEVQSIETAALAFYADNSAWPDDTGYLVSGSYINTDPVQLYEFDSFGKAEPTIPGDWDGSGAAEWESGKWVRS